MKFVQAALPHEENEKIQRSSCQCSFHIETILKKTVRNGECESSRKKKKKDCCNFFIAICTLSTKWFSPQKILLFLWLISGSNGLCKSRSSLAKWIISNCFDFTFRLLVPPSAGWDCAWRWWQIPAGWGLVCVLLLWEQSLCYVLRCPGFALCYQKELCCLVRWIWSFDPPSSCSGPGKYQVHQ